MFMALAGCREAASRASTTLHLELFDENKIGTRLAVDRDKPGIRNLHFATIGKLGLCLGLGTLFGTFSVAGPACLDFDSWVFGRARNLDLGLGLRLQFFFVTNLENLMNFDTLDCMVATDPVRV